MTPEAGRRITIVCPSLLAHDAVGNAAAELYNNLAKVPGNHVSLLTRGSDRTDVPVTVVTSVTDMMYNDAFLRADVLIYTYAIFSDLFNVLLVGNGRAAQVIRFHNVTPVNLVAERDRPLIEQSMRQLQIFRSADEIWADSRENVEELTRRGIDAGIIRLMPLGVSPLVHSSILEKPTGPVRFAYIGRIVKAKGIDELIQAAGLLQKSRAFEFELDLCGNLRHSSPVFLAKLRSSIAELGLTEHVTLRGSLSDEDLGGIYRRANIFVSASHHEGFCVPVIEGLAAGCVPVSYANSNLRYIHAGLGRLASEQTPDALAEAMQEVGEALTRIWRGEPALLNLAGGPLSLEAFDREATALVADFAPDLYARRVQGRIMALTDYVEARAQ